METIYSNTQPDNPAYNQEWVDTSVVPNRQFRWNGFNWIPMDGNSQNHAALTHLSFDQSGHTGFAPIRHPHFLSELEGAEDVLKKIRFHPENGDPIDGQGVRQGEHVEIAYENDSALLRFDVVNVAEEDHPHEQSDISGLNLTLSGKQSRIEKGQPEGYAPLDSQGRVPIEHIPPLSFGGTSTVPPHPHAQYAEKDVLSSPNGDQVVDFTNLRNVPGIGHESYKASVAFFQNLPTSGNTTGDVRLVTSQGLFYWWDSLQWRQAGFLNFTHSQLNGNGADDHPQYFNEERGDNRYYTKTSANTTFATKDEVNALSLGPALQVSFPLQDNQASAIGTGYTLDTTMYRGSSLIYMVERGVSLVFGNLSLAHMINAPYINEAREVLTTDVGVTFSVTIVGDNLILNYTSTSTGEAATLKICEKIKFYL